MLHHDTKEGRFDLHPIVRRYAYDRLAAPDRAAAHTRLRDYFAAVPEPDTVTGLDDLAAVIELYHHTVRAGQFHDALTLLSARLWDPLYTQLSAYQLLSELLRALFPDGEDRPPCLEDQDDKDWTLNAMAIAYSHDGQPRRAVPLLEQQLANYESRGEEWSAHLAIGSGNMAEVQLKIGVLGAAETNQRRRMRCAGRPNSSSTRPTGTRNWENCLPIAARMPHRNRNWGRRRRCGKTKRMRTDNAWCGPTVPGGNFSGCAPVRNRRAVVRNPYSRRLAVRWNWRMKRRVHIPRASATSSMHIEFWERGTASPASLSRPSITWTKRWNAVAEAVPWTSKPTFSSTWHGCESPPLRRTRRSGSLRRRSSSPSASGYVLQGADAHIELAKFALARGDKSTARDHATEARRLATCDGPPDYTYKAAYDEAGALLTQLT